MLKFIPIIIIAVFASTNSYADSSLIGKYPYSIFSHSIYRQIIRNIIPDNHLYERFKIGLDAGEPIGLMNGVITGIGCIPHDCPDNGSIFIIKNGILYIAVKEESIFRPLHSIPLDIQLFMQKQLFN